MSLATLQINSRLLQPDESRDGRTVIRNRTTEVLLNGQHVPGLRSVKVEWAKGDITVATLTILVDDLVIDSDTLIELVALAESRREQ